MTSKKRIDLVLFIDRKDCELSFEVKKAYIKNQKYAMFLGFRVLKLTYIPLSNRIFI